MSSYNFFAVLVSLFIIICTLYGGQNFIIPIFVSSLLALLMVPVSNKLEHFGFNRFFSSIFSILIIVSIIKLIFLIFYYYISQFVYQSDIIITNIYSSIDRFQALINKYFHINIDIINHIKSSILSLSREITFQVKNFILALAKFGILTVFIFFYSFFLLFYRDRLYNFIMLITKKDEHNEIHIVINNIIKVISNYLMGYFSVILILATLNSLGFYLIGLNYAIFFGCLIALLNIIPYVGILFGSLIPIIYVFLTTGSFITIFLIILMLSLVQFIESNYLTPTIVGSKLNINPLAIITAAFLGKILWGTAGLILFIPLIGILKVICDHINALKNFCYLIARD